MYGETFLGLADTYGKSILYQAIGSRFVKYQEISTQWAHGIKRICARRSHMPCSSNKEKFSINSTVYKFN